MPQLCSLKLTVRQSVCVWNHAKPSYRECSVNTNRRKSRKKTRKN